ncbi:GNAT family N-acetyltransferase [Acinetobacter chinensis]|uniref:GNAT family N-acetyltransferase n=1 Tax=Acinetobacter chinensis TaxID=2004650 RepID=A0ABU3WKI1_9GAMM|nr:GNAT family N-acetyltransferase [Acinetobacter chinensis]MDV2470558.1 GNAT family N-acetyltransferase [Acinetobacter chinensis]
MLKTERLILRQWEKSDYLPFIKMSLDPDVMKYLPGLLTEEESLHIIKTVKKIIDNNGWGIWAVELKENHRFIGFIGLHEQSAQFDFSPCIEIAWRLSKEHWGNGYATEGAKAVLDYAFHSLNFDKIVSFTASVNIASEAIMKKLDMTKVKEFTHPEFSSNPYAAKHVLYEINHPRLKKPT